MMSKIPEGYQCLQTVQQYSPANANLFMYVKDADATYKKALDNNATVVTELNNQSYIRSGGVKDTLEIHSE